MKLLWAGEKRVDWRGEPYCIIKPSTLNNIFQRRQFNRFGKVVSPEEYYGFSYSQYQFPEGDNSNPHYSAILNPKIDKGFIQFARAHSLFPE